MKVITTRQAAELVQSGWTVASAGFVGAGHAEGVTEALESRFLQHGLCRHPSDFSRTGSCSFTGNFAWLGVGSFQW